MHVSVFIICMLLLGLLPCPDVRAEDLGAVGSGGGNSVDTTGSSGGDGASDEKASVVGSYVGPYVGSEQDYLTAGELATLYDQRLFSYGLGPFKLTPMLKVSETYNDNMYFNNQNRKGSLLTQVQLGLTLGKNYGNNYFALQYGFTNWTWHSSSGDNYLDQFVGGSSHLEFTNRNRVDFNATYIDSHNLYGTYLTAPGLPGSVVNQIDQYHEYNSLVKYRYGAASATGNLELLAGVNDLTYDSRKNITSAYDKTRFYVTPGFYYRISPKTQLLAQVEATWYQYHQSSSAAINDFTQERYLIGTTWKATGKSTGTVRLGYMMQQYRSGAPTNPGFTGDVGVVWSPMSYNSVSLNMSRNNSASSGFGTSYTTSQVSLGYMHLWPNKITTHLSAGYNYIENQNVSTPGVHSNQVNNSNYTFMTGVTYLMHNWLTFGLNYTYRSISSSYNVQNFDQNSIMLSITANPGAVSQTSAPWKFNF